MKLPLLLTCNQLVRSAWDLHPLSPTDCGQHSCDCCHSALLMHRPCCVQILEAACSILEVTADSCQPLASQPRQKPQAAPVGSQPQPRMTKRLCIPGSGGLAADQALHMLDPANEAEERHAAPLQAAGAGAALNRSASCIVFQGVRPSQGRLLLFCPASPLQTADSCQHYVWHLMPHRARLGPDAPEVTCMQACHQAPHLHWMCKLCCRLLIWLCSPCRMTNCCQPCCRSGLFFLT